MPIKIKEEKIKKAPSRVIKSTDENYDKIRRQICDLYIACQNMADSYDLFRRATMGDDYAKIDTNRSSASIWFAKADNQSYIAKRKLEIAKIGFDEYCKVKNIEHAAFTAIKDKIYEDIANMTPFEIRQKNYIELEKLKDTTVDSQTIAGIIKQQTDLMDAKLKDKSIELSAEEKFIHHYLPAKVCDTCPNKQEIIDQFKESPEIETDDK